jgi:lipopolysaccharide/colanic/teichoic acid biosynthesis glycosyltransferase
MAAPYGLRGPLILSEELFREVVIKERKRADRSNRPVALLLVAVNDRMAAKSAAIWLPVIEALTEFSCETDVLGWFESHTVLGLILSENRAFDGDANALDRRVRRALAGRLDPRTPVRFSIRLHVHPQPRRVQEEGGWPVRDFPMVHSRQDRGTIYEVIKRGLDIIGSLSLLVVLSPLFLLIAALVKAGSRGPVFFRQVRVGRLMQPFTILKFRTMYCNVDTAVHQAFVTQFINGSCQPEDAARPKLFKLTNDTRISPIGHFLRKTSLDELPQFWNVLRGEMSLVGPRPPLPYELEQYKPWHCRRVLEAKPGITGLWQVSGRSRTTFDDMVRLDLRYAKTCSFWTDLKILLATPGAVIAGKGAC